MKRLALIAVALMCTACPTTQTPGNIHVSEINGLLNGNPDTDPPNLGILGRHDKYVQLMYSQMMITEIDFQVWTRSTEIMREVLAAAAARPQ